MAKAKTGKTNPEHKVCEAALKLIARQGWNRVTLDDIGRAAKISPAQMKQHCPGKHDLLPALVRFFDSQMLEGIGKPDPKAAPHDRLFEILMARIDALQLHRKAILSIMDAAKRNPRAVQYLLPAQAQAMRGILGHAGLEPDRLREPFVLAGLLGVYGFTLCTWRKDESPDMSRTMAALDRYLRRASSIADILFRHK